MEGNNSRDGEDIELGRVNESARLGLQPCAYNSTHAPPELAYSPRLPIMARLATLLSVPVRFGPVSAQSEYCTVLSHPGAVYYVQLRPLFVYLNASTTICHLISNGISCGYVVPLLNRYFNLHCCRGTIPSLSSGPRAAPSSPKNL